MARTKGKKRKWPVVHPRAAGIDIGSKFHVVALSEDLDAEPVRTFSTFTNDLHRLLGNWRCCSTTPCAMAWSTPIRAPRTMRNGIANASLPTCAGVLSRWGLFSRR